MRQTYRDVLLADKPAGLWMLDDASGLFLDATGHGHNATNTGGTMKYAKGLPSGEAQGSRFNAGTAHADLGSGVNWNAGQPNTFELWVSVLGLPAVGAAAIISKGANTLAVAGALYTAPAGDLVWYLFNGTTDEYCQPVASNGSTTNLKPFATPGLHHIVITIDTSNAVRMYVDGVAQVILHQQGPGYANTWADPPAGMVVTQRNTSGTTDVIGQSGVLTDAADLLLCAVAVYQDVVLSPARVLAHYRAGLGQGWSSPDRRRGRAA